MVLLRIYSHILPLYQFIASIFYKGFNKRVGHVTGTCQPSFINFCSLLLSFSFPPVVLFLIQELRCREEELKRAALEQKSHEEFLRQREQQLAQWEQDVFERELSLLILHLNQNQEKPNVKKRKGTFKKHKLKGKNGEISMPQGLRVLSNTVKIVASKLTLMK